jgi:glycosyltransferase involved in cell wall biosynthesis
MKLSACVIFQDGDDLKGWRDSLPADNIEVVALRTAVNPSLKEPVFQEVGRIDDHIVLSWEYPDFEEYFDFSYCRNKLDEYATGDWILHMDSDERLASPHDEFWAYIEELNNTEAVAAYLSIGGCNNDLDPQYTHIRKRYNIPAMRLHRRSAFLKWQRICHETLEVDPNGTVVADTDILLYHKGYSQDTEVLMQKAERNGGLMVREYTRDKSQRNWDYLVNTFAYLKQLSKR